MPCLTLVYCKQTKHLPSITVVQVEHGRTLWLMCIISEGRQLSRKQSMFVYNLRDWQGLQEATGVTFCAKLRF